ncbi:MAG: hypothetical protein V2J24_21020 [Pseudomonadales bacterium]|nr:hypothetical protein [Pseudomonadales bacterium]
MAKPGALQDFVAIQREQIEAVRVALRDEFPLPERERLADASRGLQVLDRVLQRLDHVAENLAVLEACGLGDEKAVPVERLLGAALERCTMDEERQVFARRGVVGPVASPRPADVELF